MNEHDEDCYQCQGCKVKYSEDRKKCYFCKSENIQVIQTVTDRPMIPGTRIRIEEGKEEPECPICLEKCKDKSMVGALHCGHFIHIGCIEGWMVYNHQCPICRDNLPIGYVKEVTFHT